MAGMRLTETKILRPDGEEPATVSLGAYWYASTHANGRTSLQADVYNTFLPRAGFSWAIRPNTTIRGGFGLYAYNWSLDTYGGGMGASVSSSGSFSDSTNGITPVALLGGNGNVITPLRGEIQGILFPTLRLPRIQPGSTGRASPITSTTPRYPRFISGTCRLSIRL